MRGGPSGQRPLTRAAAKLAHDSRVGAELKRQRDNLGLSLAQLEERVAHLIHLNGLDKTLSRSLLDKIERGHRGAKPATLGLLFDALSLDSFQRDHISSIALPEMFPLTDTVRAPLPRDRFVVDALNAPASIMSKTTWTVLAFNEPFNALFPGFEQGTSLVEYILLHPIARLSIANWNAVAHTMVRSVPGLHRPEDPATTELSRRLQEAPELERFLTTAPRRLTEVIEFKDLTTKQIHTYSVHHLRFDDPRRGFRLYALQPHEARSADEAA